MLAPKYKCICDTSVWVRVCIGDVHDTYVENFSIIGIADVVKNEISKWKRETNKYAAIHSLFIQYEKTDLKIINRESLDIITQKIIENDLVSWGFTDLDNSSKTISDLGEFVSLLYAYHLNIPYIHIHDNNFCNTIQYEELYSQYKGIQTINWNELSNRLTANDTQRLALNKRVETESKTMTAQKQLIKKKKKENLDSKLEALQKMYSKR